MKNYNEKGQPIEGIALAKYRLETIIEIEKERIDLERSKGVRIVEVTIKNLATDALNALQSKG